MSGNRSRDPDCWKCPASILICSCARCSVRSVALSANVSKSLRCDARRTQKDSSGSLAIRRSGSLTIRRSEDLKSDDHAATMALHSMRSTNHTTTTSPRRTTRKRRHHNHRQTRRTTTNTDAHPTEDTKHKTGLVCYLTQFPHATHVFPITPL